MFLSLNIDLLLVGTTVVVSFIFGFVVFLYRGRSITNFLFVLYAATNSIWSVVNYLVSQLSDEGFLVWLFRLEMFFVLLSVFFLYLFVSTFPRTKFQMSKRVLGVLASIVSLVLVMTLTSRVVSGVDVFLNGVYELHYKYGIFSYISVLLFLLIAALYLSVKRLFEVSKRERKEFVYIVVGLSMTLFLIFVFNFLNVVVLGDVYFAPVNTVFTVPFVAFAFYAIVKHERLDLNVISIEVLAFSLIVLSFFELLMSTSLGEVIYNSSVFVVLLIFGIFVVRSVIRSNTRKEEMDELNKKLRELDKQKDEFVSLAAHELRAPMTALKGYISMVIQGDAGDIPEKARGFLADANVINERLIRLVNNMLNVSRIEEGRMVYQLEVESLSLLVRAVYSQFAAEAERKGLKYNLDIPREIVDKVRVDSDRVQEVIANLLSNAVKYTDFGTVTVKLCQPDKDTVRLEVIDTGPGISKPEQKKLFRKYYRVESNIGKTTGSGLGLYISKLLIDRFSGKIGLDSDVGRGSNFWFELPLVKTK